MALFNPLEHPLCFSLQPRVAPSAWTGHVPFALLLVELLRPAVIVELGTYYGVSYCAFCQAVKELKIEARCYAVDTWQGDPQSGFYGPEVLADLKSYHDPLYGGFSRLIQSTFEEALSHFEDGSIDLLHIDGFHTYEEVKRDFELWLPKMSQRGVVLFHDINVREKDFGVWRLWEDCKRRFPHFEFIHAHGLGLLAVGNACPKSLQMFWRASGDETQRIREFFFQLGMKLESSQEAQALLQTVQHQASLKETVRSLEQQLQESQLALQQKTRELQDAERQLQVKQDAERRLQEKDESLDLTRQQLQEVERQLHSTSQQLSEAMEQAAQRQELYTESEHKRQEIEQQFNGISQLLQQTEQQLKEKDEQLRADAERHRVQESGIRQKTQRLEDSERQLRQLLQETERHLTQQLNEREQYLTQRLEEREQHFTQLLEDSEQQLTQKTQQLYASDWLLREKEGQLADLAQATVARLSENESGGARSLQHDDEPRASQASKRPSEDEAAPQGMPVDGHHNNGLLLNRIFKLIIGIVTFNNHQEQLEQLLKSINLSVEGIGDLPVEVEIFVLDNGEQTEWLETHLPLAKFASQGNIGFGKAMNRLMSAAFASPATEWFLCLNPDGVLNHKALRELLLCSGQNPTSLIEARQFPEEHLKPYDPETLETSWASGACLLIRRGIYQKLGGFDPNFFMYLEDVDLSWRARAAGLSVKISPNSLFGHDVLSRAPNSSADKNLLLSGRYLAYKWRNSDFLHWAEQELVQRGYYSSSSDLPALPQLNFATLNINTELTDFAHYFHFSQARW
jgi:GT2 family glycosyltransferase